MKLYLALLMTVASTYALQTPVMEAALQATDDGIQEQLMGTPGAVERRRSVDPVCYKSKLSPAEKAIITKKYAEYRKKHGRFELKWRLWDAGAAEVYLKKCSCEKCGKTSQTIDKLPCGKSVAVRYGVNVGIGSSVGAIVDEWYSRKKFYGPKKGQCKEKGACNPYIQMMYGNLEGFGCSKKNCSGKIVLACTYSNDGPTDASSDNVRYTYPDP